ncbi:pantetheine-phosphate adenylyltransferase [Candidatus Woesearchaeota archaeon]|nr:pantetheine-phosphate adenylyltransferase [Candidatus Woesearchaeota archaeon]
MQDIAIYPGSFDPITMGHIDVLERSLKIFKKVVVAIGESSEKDYLFTTDERVKMVKGVTKGMNVSVEKFSGLLVDFAKSKKASVIIRGLRAVSDFDYEFQAALMNRKLNPEIETIFIMTRGKYCYLSSSVVKEVASRGGNMQHLVPEAVKKMLIGKFGKIK